MNFNYQFNNHSRANFLCRLGLLLFSANLGASPSNLRGTLQLSFDTPQAEFVANSTDFVHKGQLRNISNTTIQAPISVALTELTPKDTSLSIQPVDGINADGHPYTVLLDKGELKPNQTLPVAIHFAFKHTISRLAVASIEKLASKAFAGIHPQDTPVAFSYNHELLRIPAGNHQPTAKADVRWSNQRVVLDASQSSDMDDSQLLSYQWSLMEKPIGSQVTIPSASAKQTLFTPDIAGIYSIRLVVDDGFEYSLPDTTTLSITLDGNGVENHLPVIFSTPNTAATGTRLYTYKVTASDSDGDNLNYSLAESPSDMKIDANTGVISWVAPQPHHDGMQYRVVVNVKDGKGGLTSQSFDIAVNLCTCL